MRLERFPLPGETVAGNDFLIAGGGKGANQAVAAARLGADVTFVARLGSDVFGTQALRNFKKDGICTDYITRDEQTASGVALIFVDANGENVIAVAAGANNQLRPEHIQSARCAIEEADVLVMQLEIPLDTATATAEVARNAGTKVILNPAPAMHLPKTLLANVDVLTPNETEAAFLTGKDLQPEQAARRLLDMGITTVVMTLGAKGALVVLRGNSCHVPSPQVKALDTTAAGDAFNGALAVGLAEGRDIIDATRFAVKTAAISVTRAGAQPSLPYRREVKI